MIGTKILKMDLEIAEKIEVKVGNHHLEINILLLHRGRKIISVLITKDYSKGPRVVRKDYVLWKIQNMKESASMPSFCGQSQFSIRSLVALKLKLKNFVFGQSLLPLKIF